MKSSNHAAWWHSPITHNPPVGTVAAPDYFEELLERIRDIRASEKRVYLRMREIFTLAADYQPDYKETTQFFKVIQNKLHFACTGHTAAEIIHARADANKPMMGLTHTSNGEVRKKDITVAKNYLNETEISNLNRVVNHVAGLRRRPSKTPKTNIPARLARKTGTISNFQ